MFTFNKDPKKIIKKDVSTVTPHSSPLFSSAARTTKQEPLFSSVHCKSTPMFNPASKTPSSSMGPPNPKAPTRTSVKTKTTTGAPFFLLNVGKLAATERKPLVAIRASDSLPIADRKKEILNQDFWKDEDISTSAMTVDTEPMKRKCECKAGEQGVWKKGFPLVVYFDLETTDIDTERARIIQIGAQVDPEWIAAHLRDDYPSEEFNMSPSFNRMCRPQALRDADGKLTMVTKGALEVHGITNKMLENKQSSRDVLIAFLAWLEQWQECSVGGCVLLVAYNCFKFDKVILDKELKRSGLKYTKGEIRYADALDGLDEFRALGLSRYMSMQQACRILKVLEQTETQKHTALEDVKLLLKVPAALPCPELFYDALRREAVVPAR